MEQRAMILDFEVALDVCSDSCHACGGDGMLNLYPIHLAKYTTNRNLFDQALGRWNSHVGYRMSEQERTAIRENLDSVFQAELYGASAMIMRISR